MAAALKRAGFVEHHQKGSHLYLHHPARNLMTSVPIHGREMKRGTVHAILKQAGLSEDEFRELL
jgi:predicted RNA binding protein YcfA (HicA-like mRNA interferase family)